MTRASVILVLFCLPAMATTSWVQSLATNTACSSTSGTSCTINGSSSPTALAATAVGNVGLMFGKATTGNTMSAPTAGGTWAACPNFPVTTSNVLYCWWTVFTSSVSTITAGCTTSGTCRGAWYYEGHSTITTPPWTMDAANASAATSPCTNCTFQSLTLSGTNDVAVQIIAGVASSNCTGAGNCGDYSNFEQGSGGNTISSLVSWQNTSTVGSGQTWTNSSTSNVVVGAVAISEGALPAAPAPAPLAPVWIWEAWQ